MSAARILVVDDNPTNLKLAVQVLGFEGYEMLQAESAEAALKVIEGECPDLILMDIQMPGMDGLTLTRRLKGDPRTRLIPIVAMTSFAMKGDDRKAAEAGCDGYLTKPINTRGLPGQVAGLLARVRAGEPQRS